MAITITPGILAVVVILAVELVVIIVVITYLLWRGHGGKRKSELPEGGNYKDKDSPKDDDDVCIIENEEIDQKPIPAPRSTSRTSLTSCDANSSPYYETNSSETDEDESVEEEKHSVVDEEIIKDEVIPDESAPPIPPIVASSSEDSSSSDQDEKEEEEKQSEEEKVNNEESDDNEEKNNKEAEENNEIDNNEEEPEIVAAMQESDEDIKEKIPLESKQVNAGNDVTIQTSPIQEPEPTPRLQSFDLGGITLSLRIEPGKSAPSVHVNGQSFESNNMSSSDSDESHDNDDIQVIRRYESSETGKPIIYDPVQQKVIDSNLHSGTFVSSSEDDYDVTGEIEGEEEAVAGIINVTTGEKLTICQAVKNGLIPKKTALLLLEAQAATGSVVNPRNGVKLSVNDAVTLGIVDEVYRPTLVAAEGAFYGYMDPRTAENVSLSTAMSRGIFPRAQGVRLLEAQAATGGVIDPWTGLRYPLAGALSKGLIDRETANMLRSPEEQTDFFDPSTQKRLGYADLLGKCIRDLDTGLKFLYIEEKPKINENRYQPELLTFRSAFRRKVTLQELIDAGLVDKPVLDSFQAGKINKEELRDILQPYLVGGEPIAGILNKTTHKVLTICQAVNDGLLRRGTALELLEAQAATGSMIDPISGKKMSVSRAVAIGLVDRPFASSLRRAEQAVHGYTEPGTNRTISLFEAMARGVVIESHGIRMLEAQLATGGVIDPQAGYRIPADVALERNLFDQRMSEILTNTNNDLKGYYDPNTGDNLTYGELMHRCVRNKKKYGNMLLLPLKDKAPMAAAMQRGPYRHRKVIIMDPQTRKHLTVDQAVAANVIDHNTAQNLTKQEGMWTEHRHT